ncbi:ABC transporter permease [Pullulanibacillus sp. KACC 23026]|uniref:ABC transporter permease n=1 Tax=Pullulanibacillus sp. KACC 23026 TaxID=3028315 RepID=UPI0023B0C8E3|nr:ABC transporter permease [Pullulanibacillus sp. KACC 23026]WEG14730.1 ABC transporter permease [Pullulanibacillus sp. KACC 23026]
MEVIFLFGMLVFQIKLPFTTFGVLIIIWMVSIFSACGFGLIIGSFCLWSPSMHMWSNLLASLLLLLSGANYSLEAMPVWVRIMAQCVPLTRGVELTKAIINSEDYSKVDSLLTQEFLLGCIGFLISLVMIKYAEYLSRIKGTMDLD